MFEIDPTRTQQTETVYLKKARGLLKRAQDELVLTDPNILKGSTAPLLDAQQFVAWLVDLKPTIDKKTWRLYKSAVIFYLENQHANDSTVLEAIDYLREQDSKGCVDKTEQTSATKLKKFPWKDFQKITDYLRANTGKWHAALLDWLVSATLTGLRPQEWVNAQIVVIQGERALVINNAKTTNGRSHGPTRTLLLGALASEEIDTLKNHIDRVKKWSSLDQYDSLYDGCSLSLNYISRKIWPNRVKHITLYSCRHQFTANAKASGFSTAEIAAMMGHAVDTTAQKHYGKKTAGHELLRVRALESDIQKVVQKGGSLQKPRNFKEPEPKPQPKKNA